MRIAQIAPLAESVPPTLYGGTERIVSYLTEELVALGHDVTLFASADSATRARLVPCAPRALRLDPRVRDPLPHLLCMLERVRQLAHEFDVLHFHLDPPLHMPLFRALAQGCLTTLHGRLDLPDLQPLFREFRDMALSSISESQRAPLPRANWAGTVYHGLPDATCPFNPEPRGRYLAFLGRASPEKGMERAIEIARRARTRLRIGAKIDATDERYFRERVAPQLRGPLVRFEGEVAESEKPAFLGNATALLFPIDWPEPFGLVMIEAMSCGTPVIAWPHGAVPEVVDHGVTGFIVNSIDEAAAAVHRVARLPRAQVRARFEERFRAGRMARDYLSLYAGVIREPAARRLTARQEPHAAR
jgi:glycosyltransferase involved in cell wall biosynthesis